MKKISVSPLNTIFLEENKEVLLEDFLKKLEKNIKKKEFSVVYNESDLSFDIIYYGKKYNLVLNNEEKKNYLNGNANDYFSRLIELSKFKKILNDIENQKKLEIKQQEEEKRKRNEIIAKAQKGIIPDDKSKLVYYEYLNYQNKHLYRKTIKEKLNLLCRKWFPCILGLEFIIFLILFFFPIPGIDQVGLLEYYNEFNKAWVLKYAIISFLPITIISPIITSIVGIINAKKEKRIIKHKIKELKKYLGIERNKKEVKKKKSEKTISKKIELSVSQIEYKDLIHRMISELDLRIENITNTKEKMNLKSSLRNILIEYRDGIKRIQEKEINILDYLNNTNDLNSLQMTTKKKLIELEVSINNAIVKEINLRELELEGQSLEKRLEPIIIDADKIDGILNERNSNLALVYGKH